MRRPSVAGAVLLVLFAGGASSVLAAVSDYIGRPIASVRVIREGEETADPSLVQVIETRAGEPLSMVQVRESITHLFSLGLFEDVQVDAALEGGRVALRYQLVPIHSITRIRFDGDTGAPGVDTGVLQRALTDRFGVTPASSRTTEMARVVTDALIERGYSAARVTAAVELTHNPHRATLTLTLAPGARTTIGQVQIVGTPSVSRDELLRRLGLAAGAPFERDALTVRIDRYLDERRRDGYYEAKIAPSVAFSDEGRVANVTLAVDPGPHVRVVFAGDPLPAYVRADLVPVQREGSVDEDLLEDSTSRIEDYLRTLGYRDARAPHARERSGNELVITFTIRRGPQYRVASVAFDGNSAVPSAELEPLVRLRDGQPFSDGRMDADASAIEDLYRRRGYAAAKVQPSATPQPNGAPIPVAVRYEVAEGPQTFVDAIAFADASSIPEAELRAALTLQPGAPYVPGQLAADRDAITAMYADRGYENATVTPAPQFNADNTRVQITYAVIEGPQIFVDHVIIAGNVRTATPAIERELQIRPGDPLSLSKINDAQRRLLGLGLFRRARIDELRHGDERRRDLLVTVEESPPTTVSYGFGGEGRLLQVSEQDAGAGTSAAKLQIAPRTFAQYTRRNLFGKAQSVSLFGSLSVPLNQTTASGGLPEYQAIGTYREPRLFDTPTDGLLNLTFEQQIRSSFTFRRALFTAQAARRVSKSVSLTGAYVAQRTELVVVNVTNSSDIFLIDRLFSKDPLRLSGFTLSAIRDTRNDQANPSAGQYLSVNGQVDAVALGSQVGFIKSFFRAQTFHVVPRTRVVFAANASLGVASEFDTAVPIPEPERFFAGGDTTNRGFALDSLGVRHEPANVNVDTIDPANGLPIGGNATVIFNGELRVPVTGGLSVVGFADSGQVFQRASQMTFGELRSALGFGIRYQSPFGPLRIDLGFKTSLIDNESRPALHISFGQAF
ncbi:MAG TPA: POTRA domain-containing protein [Vicinamibacterales bacterium]|nr:POTRA domain-containing protein [Vicinamibacterales bacterium]